MFTWSGSQMVQAPTLAITSGSSNYVAFPWFLEKGRPSATYNSYSSILSLENNIIDLNNFFVSNPNADSGSGALLIFSRASSSWALSQTLNATVDQAGFGGEGVLLSADGSTLFIVASAGSNNNRIIFVYSQSLSCGAGFFSATGSAPCSSCAALAASTRLAAFNLSSTASNQTACSCSAAFVWSAAAGTCVSASSPSSSPSSSLTPSPATSATLPSPSPLLSPLPLASLSSTPSVTRSSGSSPSVTPSKMALQPSPLAASAVPAAGTQAVAGTIAFFNAEIGTYAMPASLPLLTSALFAALSGLVPAAANAFLSADDVFCERRNSSGHLSRRERGDLCVIGRLLRARRKHG